MKNLAHPHPGLFIAVEGIDGAGKTYAIQQLRAIVANADRREPVMVREPGGTPFGESLRQILAEHAETATPDALASPSTRSGENRTGAESTGRIC